MTNSGKTKPIIYFDSCCFIDVASVDYDGDVPEERTEDVWYSKKLLEASLHKDVQVCTSELTILECLHLRRGRKKVLTEDVRRLFESIILSRKYVLPIEFGRFVRKRAMELNWEHKLKFHGFDLLHISSALVAGCDEFLTFNCLSIMDFPYQIKIL